MLLFIIPSDVQNLNTTQRFQPLNKIVDKQINEEIDFRTIIYGSIPDDGEQ